MSSHLWLFVVGVVWTLYSCGHQQKLNTAQFIPILQHVKSTPEGFELWFSATAGKQVAIWTRNNGAKTGKIIESLGPIDLVTQQHTLEIRFAYVSLGEVEVLSPWTKLYRIEAPPYPAIRCQFVKDGTLIEWSSQEPARYKSWYVHHGQGLWIGPLPVTTRMYTSNTQLENVFIEWHSDEVRGRRIPLNCMH